MGEVLGSRGVGIWFSKEVVGARCSPGKVFGLPEEVRVLVCVRWVGFVDGGCVVLWVGAGCLSG